MIGKRATEFNLISELGDKVVVLLVVVPSQVPFYRLRLSTAEARGDHIKKRPRFPFVSASVSV